MAPSHDRGSGEDSDGMSEKALDSPVHSEIEVEKSCVQNGQCKKVEKAQVWVHRAKAIRCVGRYRRIASRKVMLTIIDLPDCSEKSGLYGEKRRDDWLGAY